MCSVKSKITQSAVLTRPNMTQEQSTTKPKVYLLGLLRVYAGTDFFFTYLHPLGPLRFYFKFTRGFLLVSAFSTEVYL